MTLTSTIEAKNLSIVIIGNFNPAIVQPYWLANKGLIREEEAGNANIEFIHKDFSRFTIDWAFIEVQPDRFELRTEKEPYFEILMDLCLGIFNNLSETPIQAIGINHIRHLSPITPEKYLEIGDRLAPLKNWDFLKEPRILTVEVLENKSDNKGYLRVVIKPSDKIRNSISVNINDHFNLGSNGHSISVLNDVFSNKWKKSLVKADEIVQNLLHKLQ